MTLLEETIIEFKANGKKPNDILWIGSKDGEYAMTWKEFEKVANFEYDDGFGAAEVAKDLVIIFKDGDFMTRGEYDGSEWWDYHTVKAFILKPNPKKITNLGGPDIMWKTIEELNK